MALATGWFGHGSWSAPYWFIGMEPGGDESAANLALWQEAGRPEFTDITRRHPDHPYDWFGPPSQPQQTWQKLIWLILSFSGVEPTAAAALAYQRQRLGRRDGETTLLEMSPFAAPSVSVEAPRDLGRDERVTRIRAQILTARPTFVVFYSSSRSYAEAWARIAGAPLVEGRLVLVGRSVCVMTHHPQRRRDKAYWIEIGQRLREAVGACDEPGY